MPNFNSDKFIAFLRIKLLDRVDDRQYIFRNIMITPSAIEIFENNKELLLGAIWKENECTGGDCTTTHHFFDDNRRFNLVLSFDYEGAISLNRDISIYRLNLIHITNFELQDVVQI